MRSHWKTYGCTIMADGWTDNRQRSLINFLIYGPKGISFVKSVDASGMVKTAENLFKLFEGVIEWVGPENVVQVVTDNAANYAAAGTLIHLHYRHIFWTPCVAHTINLVMKDICSLPDVCRLAKNASKITVFVYNHGQLLNWLRQKDTWKEIVRPGATRFATTFLTLDSIGKQRGDLEALMVSEFFRESTFSKSEVGKAVKTIVLDQLFWEECSFIVELTKPIVRLLRIVDSDEMPALGYVYEGYRRVEKAVMTVW
ncbi:hypothetical protein LINGRAHAP2_LOCUS31448 [Linum grandiflorum]